MSRAKRVRVKMSAAGDPMKVAKAREKRLAKARVTARTSTEEKRRALASRARDLGAEIDESTPMLIDEEPLPMSERREAKRALYLEELSDPLPDFAYINNVHKFHVEDETANAMIDDEPAPMGFVRRLIADPTDCVVNALQFLKIISSDEGDLIRITKAKDGIQIPQIALLLYHLNKVSGGEPRSFFVPYLSNDRELSRRLMETIVTNMENNTAIFLAKEYYEEWPLPPPHVEVRQIGHAFVIWKIRGYAYYVDAQTDQPACLLRLNSECMDTLFQERDINYRFLVSIPGEHYSGDITETYRMPMVM